MVWLQAALAAAFAIIIATIALALRETNRSRRAAILIVGSSVAIAIMIAAGQIPGVSEP